MARGCVQTLVMGLFRRNNIFSVIASSSHKKSPSRAGIYTANDTTISTIAWTYLFEYTSLNDSVDAARPVDFRPFTRFFGFLLFLECPIAYVLNNGVYEDTQILVQHRVKLFIHIMPMESKAKTYSPGM